MVGFSVIQTVQICALSAESRHHRDKLGGGERTHRLARQFEPFVLQRNQPSFLNESTMHRSFVRQVLTALIGLCLFLCDPGLHNTYPAENAGETKPQNRLSPDEIAAGWINLFDGKTTFGWKAN